MIKKVGYALYAHKSNISELYSILNKDDVIRLSYVLSINQYDYDIIKYDRNNKNVSLIECETWNTLNEPIVGDSHCYRIDGTISFIKGGSKIYHNKWQFVSENYCDFDINKAKQRTIEWNSISGIKKVKSKIGNKNFWYELLLKNGLSI